MTLQFSKKISFFMVNFFAGPFFFPFQDRFSFSLSLSFSFSFYRIKISCVSWTAPKSWSRYIFQSQLEILLSHLMQIWQLLSLKLFIVLRVSPFQSNIVSIIHRVLLTYEQCHPVLGPLAVPHLVNQLYIIIKNKHFFKLHLVIPPIIVALQIEPLFFLLILNIIWRWNSYKLLCYFLNQFRVG